MEYLRNIYKQRDFNDEELSKEIHSLQTEMIFDSNNASHHEKKNKILSELYQITSIPISQIKMPTSRWDEFRLNIYIFIASMLPNSKQIPNLNLETKSGPLFYIICFLNPNYIHFIYNQIGNKNDDPNQSSSVPMNMPQNFYTKEQSISALIEIFETFTQSITNTKTTSYQFYTRTQISYGHFIIPYILLQENPEFIKDPRFMKPFRFIRNTLFQRNETLPDNEKIILNHDMHNFLFELIKHIGNKKNKALLDEAFESILPSFSDFPISSTIIPYYFSIVFQMSINNDEKSFSKIETFYQNSLLRVNDIFKSLKFNMIFDFFNQNYKFFYEQRTQQKTVNSLYLKTIVFNLMHFICQILNIPNPHDVINNNRRKNSESKPDQDFLKNLFNLYYNCDFRWPCLFFIEKIISTLTFYTRKMNVIKAIKIRDPINRNICIEKTISFYDQMSENEKQMTNINTNPQQNIDSSQKSKSKEKDSEKEDSNYSTNSYLNKIGSSVDHLLFSAFEYRTYASYEEAVNAFERQGKVYDISKKILIPLNQFGYIILQNLLQNENNRPLLGFYLERFLRALIDLIIYSSYRLMLLNTFTKTQNLYKGSSKTQPIFKSLEYAFNITKSIGDIIMRLNKHHNLPLLATILAECLFNATKKQVVTYNCVKFIFNIIRHQSSPLGILLIQKMIEILYSNCLLETSFDVTKSILFQQWLLLIIKIGDKKTPVYPPNIQFSQKLRNYQHIFISNFFSRNYNTNQPEMILAIFKYINAMKTNVNEINVKQYENPESKILLKFQKYSSYNDFRKEYRKEVSTLFLDHCIFDYQDNQIPLQFIDSALMSRNLDDIDNILNLLSKHLKRTEYYTDFDNDVNNLLFMNILKAINFLPKDYAIQLIELIPTNPPLFSPYTSTSNLSKKSYFVNIDPEIDNFYKPIIDTEESELFESNSNAQIEYHQIVNCINQNSSRTKNESQHLLMFLTILIESKQILKFTRIDLEKTIDLLLTIGRFEDLQKQVESLLEKMNKLFAPIITEEISFDYVYAFAYSFVISQLESSKYAINQFKSFIYGINITNYHGTKIADKIFSCLRPPYNIFNTLLLFTILTTKRPGCIKFNHFTSLFSLIKDQNCWTPLSKETPLFYQLFKKFVKKFILSLNSDQKTIFMNYCYSIVKNRSFNNPLIKLIIIKKMPLLNIHFDHYDPNFYRNCTDELFYFNLSIIIGCGSKIPLTQEIVDHSINNLSLNEIKQLPTLHNRLTFVLMLSKSKIDISLYLREQTLSKIFSFLFRYYNSSCSKQFDKCIRWIHDQNEELIRQAMTKNCPSTPDQFMSYIKEEKKFKFLSHIFVVFYKYIEPLNLTFVLVSITEMIKVTKTSNIINISNLFKILNLFDLEREDLRHVVNGPSQINPQISFLCQFMNDVGKLFSCQNSPNINLPIEDFIKHRVVKFLLNFKLETIRLIFTNSIEFESKYFYDILHNMIISDKTNEMFHLFIKSINPFDRYKYQLPSFPNHHPYISDIETKLSNQPEYANDDLFKELVLTQFNIFFIEKPNKILTDNDSIQLNSIVNAFINIMKNSPDFPNLVNLASFFAFGSNVYTSLYLKFKTDIFNNKDKEFYFEMITNILNECSPNYDETTNSIQSNSVSLLQIDLVNINSYRFTTNSTTAILLSNLIKGISRFSIDPNEPLFNHLLLTLRYMLNNDTQRYCGMKCFYTFYKNCNKQLPLKLISELKNVIQAIPYLLEQPEPYPIILAFKFALKLLNRDLLPEFVLSNILQHIFSFPKFFDHPYMSTVSFLFNKANQYYSMGKHSQIPEALSNSFKIFLIEKIVFFKDFDKLFFLMKCFPAIIKTVPFSIFSSLIHNIDIRDPSQFSLLFSNLDNLLKLYPLCDPAPDQIQSIFSRIAFNFLRKYLELLENQNYAKQTEFQKQPFLNTILCIMRYAKSVPEDFLLLVESKIHHENPIIARTYQTILILSIESANIQFINNHFNSITESFKCLFDDPNIKQYFHSMNIKVYIQSIFSRKNISDNFKFHFLKFIDDYPKISNQEQLLNKFEITIQLLILYVKDTKDVKKLYHLITFWNTVNGSTIQMLNLWIYNFLDFIPDLPLEQQNNLFDFIVAKLNESSIQIPFNLNLLKSQMVSSKLKLQYLNQLQNAIHDFSYDEIYSLLKLLNEFKFNCFNYKILCHLFLIIKANDEGRLIHLDELQKILGKSEEERFLNLFNHIDPKIWNNSVLIYIAFICMNHTKIIKPLIMLADCFEMISSQFAIPLFERIMNEKTVSKFHKLLISTLSLPNHDHYSELISSIINSYSQKTNETNYFTRMSPNLLYKSIKITNDTHLYKNNLSLNVIDSIPDKLLLPNSMNDDIFSLLPSNLNIETLSASAQFFLSNYDESSKIFDNYQEEIFSFESFSIESSPQLNTENNSNGIELSIQTIDKINVFLKRIMDISNDFVSKEGTFSIFERIGHDDPLLIPSLENALNSLNISANDNANNEISLATMYNILYYKHHKHPSLFETQRIISIEIILSLMNKAMSANPKKLEYLINIPKNPQLTAPNLNMKKIPPVQPLQQPILQSNIPSSLFMIPSIYINSIFFPIYSSFIRKFEDYLFSIERVQSKSKENQLSKITLNLNIIKYNKVESFDLNDSNTAIFSHEYRDLFDSFIDVNSFGFFSVTMSQVKKSTEILLRAINYDKINHQQPSGFNSISSIYKKESAEVKWPGFLFSLLTMSSTLSPSLHQAALQGYLNLIQKSSVAFFIHESYFARMLTLIGLSIVYMDDNLLSNSMKFFDLIFKDKSLISYTKFWGSQITFLYSHPRFQSQIIELLKHGYSSLQQTMHSHNLTKKPFPEQLEIINILHHLFSLVFDINTVSFDYNDEDEEDKNNSNVISIEKCCEKCLTYQSIEVDLENDVKNEINKAVQIINQRLPIDFEFSIPVRNPGSRLKIHHINNDFTKISDTIIAFTALTSYSSRQLFLVEKVESTDLLMTFANVFHLFKQLVKYSYNTRARNIRFSASLPIEIGEGMVMHTFPSDSVSISKFRFANEFNKELNEAVGKVSHIAPFFMKQYVIESYSYSVRDFLEIRNHLIANFAAYSALRSIFSLEQPKLDQLFISFRTAEFPIILSHFSVPKDYAKTATAMPDVILDFFSTTSVIEEETNNNCNEEEDQNDDDDESIGGREVSANNNDSKAVVDITNFERHFELAFASVHQSFTSYIEIFRSIIEMPIQDSLQSMNKQIDNILASRDIIEASLFDYAPPFSDGATASDSVEWFRRILEYVDNSKSPFERKPDDQPGAISIPPPSTTLLPTPTRDGFGISSNPNSSAGGFTTPTGLGLGDDFGAFDMGSLSSFGTDNIGSVGGIGSGGGGGDLSMNASGNISSMNSMNSFGSRNQINPSPSFEISQDISRNNSLIGFRSNPSEASSGSGGIGLFGSTNSLDFGGGFDQHQNNQQQHQMMNLPMIQQTQQQQQPQPQPFLNSRINSFDSGLIGFSNPQPIRQVVSPQIQMAPPMIQQPQQQQQQQQNNQQQINQSSSYIGGNDDNDDDPYSIFF